MVANQSFGAGSHKVEWDGKDAVGNAAPAAKYTIKLISHNVKLRWEGTIGNSSDERTGTTKIHGIGGVLDVLSLKGDDYMLRDYNEGYEWITRFSPDHPGEFYASGQRFTGNGLTSAATKKLASCFATDGNLIYLGMAANVAFGKSANDIVLAYDPNDDSPNALKTFSGLPPIPGVELGQNNGGKWILLNDGPDLLAKTPTSLAVQRNGSALAVAMHDSGQVVFYDKDTGGAANLPVLSMPNVAIVKWSRDDHDLLVATDDANEIKVMREEGGAWTTESKIAVPGPIDGFDVRQDLDEIAVMVGGKVQQVQIFDSKGTVLRKIGQEGGYASTPDVADDRFAFLPLNGTSTLQQVPTPAAGTQVHSLGGIAFEGKGNLRVMDRGDSRIEAFNVAGSAIGSQCFLPGQMYTAATDKNDATRVFAGFLEFHRDYSIPLVPDSSGKNGAWKLVRNWEYSRQKDGTTHGVVGSKFAGSFGLVEVITSQNGPLKGRTFAMLENDSKTYDLAELDPRVGLVDEGALPVPSAFGAAWGELLEDSDGLKLMSPDVKKANPAASTAIETIYANRLTGVQNQAGVWAGPAPVATVTYGDNSQVSMGGAAPIGGATETMGDGTVVTSNDRDFSAEGVPTIGLLPVGGTKPVLQFSVTGYNEPLRHDSSVPVEFPGEHGSYPTGGVRVAGDFICQFDHGEFTHNSEMNQISVFYKDGLPLGQTGQLFMVAIGQWAATNGAGGNFNSHWVNALPNGDLVIHCNSESMQGAISEISVKGLNSVKEYTGDLALGGTTDLGNVQPAGEPASPDDLSQKSPAVSENFSRGDSAGVGNGWDDPNGFFSIKSNALAVRPKMYKSVGMTGSLLRSAEQLQDSRQVLHIPGSLFDPTRSFGNQASSITSWGLIARKQGRADDDDAFYAEADYARSAQGTGKVQNGLFRFKMVEHHRVAGSTITDWIIAADQWSYLPASPGHSYTLTFTVRGKLPTFLHAELIDDQTGQKAVLDAENDEPSLQGSGQVGILGRYAGTVAAGYELQY